ncbi:unnamed protein product, partial [Allacma fusca]
MSEALLFFALRNEASLSKYKLCVRPQWPGYVPTL